ncbi:hypothetical protein NM208_g995 [Fusarium decemcellulare]|uniref:Uncharacterized protein n=1 Tax=Fusarium decemcellulare TaxID=57161 RepID=A0ACC1SXL0_9HYPO|nr:hypothetical protein NM208_g995 [Fusarium decemcellulare]
MPSIPDEIWHNVFSFFQCHLPQDNWWMYGMQIDRGPTSPPQALLSLSLVCKRFRRIAQPLIYRTILLEGRDDSIERQISLAKTLVSAPQLGLNTRVVTLNDALNDDLKYGSDKAYYKYQDILNSAWRSFDSPPAFKKCLEEELGRGDEVGLATFLLALMPNVRLVDLTSYATTRSLLWLLSGRQEMTRAMFLRRTRKKTGRVHGSDDNDTDIAKHDDDQGLSQGVANYVYGNYGLTHLEEVRIRLADLSAFPISIDDLEPALLHPRLKKLRLYGDMWLKNNIQKLKLPDEPWNLEYLEVKESLFTHSSLKSILTHCKSLKSLSMEMASFQKDSQDDEGPWHLDLVRFGDVLRELGQDLETLDLDILGGTNSECKRRLGSLAQLKSLRHLGIHVGILVPWQDGVGPDTILAGVLPESLQSVHLRWDANLYYDNVAKRYRDRVDLALVQFLTGNQFPNMRRITIERSESKRMNEFDGKVDGWVVHEVTHKPAWKTLDPEEDMRIFVTMYRQDSSCCTDE